jgi:hypothetical protein
LCGNTTVFAAEEDRADGDHVGMREPAFTPYFENVVLRRRPYLKREWCLHVLENPIRIEPQEGNRFRLWAAIPELDGRYLRVVTLGDMVTVHNAFPDRRFRP